MNTFLKCFLITLFAGALGASCLAGNTSKSGQAGAVELLINPWSRSAGWNAANSAGIRGIEAINTNVAGVAFTGKSELVFSHTNWLVGSDINIYTFGFSAKAGEFGAIGFSIMSMDLGEFIETTVDLPDGTGNTFNPQFLNVGLCYSKAFSERIFGGVVIRIINESIPNAGASGVALDAGIQYVTGEKKQLKFGIALRNLGPEMMYTGDGISVLGRVTGNNGYNQTLNQRTAPFDLPSLLNIGTSYDFHIGESNRVTLAGCYVSNSYTKDQTGLGFEYAFKSYLMLRAGYNYEKGITSDTKIDDFENTRTNALTGPAYGVTVELPFGKEKTGSFGLDYSFRDTDPFGGVHNIGVRIKI